MKKSPHPDWALEHKKPGTELRRINDKYYLYEVSSKWNPEKKRAKKITGKLLGRITKEDGFVESDKNKLRTSFKPYYKKPLQIKEYGASNFIFLQFQQYLKPLKEVFPDIWQEIVSLSFIRLLYKAPIKNTAFRFEHSFLSEYFHSITLGEKRVSALYRKIGSDRDSLARFMKNFIHSDDYILFDGTNFISYSKNIEGAKIGYNSKQNFEPQINILFLFSNKLQSPVFYRLLPGNIRDVKAFKLTLQEAGINNAVVISDKGFYSIDNIVTMESFSLSYIIPLRRSNTQIDYQSIQKPDNVGFDGYFEHQKRFIWYHQFTMDDRPAYLYYDSYLKTKEENDYLSRIKTHPEKYTFEKSKLKIKSFGTLALLSNLREKSAEEVYKTYKTRGDIETMIDAMKNILEVDKSYMHNEIALQGWMFISYMALKLYYQIYILLKENKLLKNYSPKDLLMHLAEVKKIKINGQWHLAEYTKKTETLLNKLKIHIT